MAHHSEGFTQLKYVRSRKVDILIVLDNSSSMAEEQATLADNLGPMIDVLSGRPGHPLPGGTRITATCSLSEHPSLSCPGLGD